MVHLRWSGLLAVGVELCSIVTDSWSHLTGGCYGSGSMMPLVYVIIVQWTNFEYPCYDTYLVQHENRYPGVPGELSASVVGTAGLVIGPT